MAQSMNGLSSISNAGLSEESNLSVNNLSCNNVSCNNVSSNGILTDTLTVLQTNGTTANYTGVVNSNKYTGDKIQITDVSCNNLFSTSIQGTDISCNKFNCDNITNIRENCGLLMTPTSVENILLGLSSGNFLTNGCNYNIAIGHQCYDSQVVSNSNGNIAVGFKAGLNMSGGSNNIYLGNLTGELEIDTNVYNNSCCIGNNSFISDSSTIFLGTVNEKTVVRGDLICQKDISCNDIESNNIDCKKLICNSLSVNMMELSSTAVSHLLNLDSNVQDSLDRISKDSGLGADNTNVSLGIFSASSLITGQYNVSIGYQSMLYSSPSANSNISIGKFSGKNIKGFDNISLGVESGQDETIIDTLSNSVAIGAYSKFNKSNQISIGTEFHTIKISGKVECDDIINKGKVKHGQYRSPTNNVTTYFFPVPFTGTVLPTVILTPCPDEFPQVSSSSLLYLVDFHMTYFSYGYLVDGVHRENSIVVHYMAMIP
jgi:hypothetical protein